MNAVTMEKGNGEYKWVNNGQKFELMTKDTFIVTKQSPFHWMNTMVTGGREWTKMEHTRNIFVDKVNKAQMINKMKIEEHNILDGQTWYHIKVPGARFIRNAPFDDMDLDIEFNGGSAIDGLFDMKVDYKLSRQGEFEEVSGSVYKIKWTGHGETTKG